MPPVRTRLACRRCREKKRRCNGQHPCRNCSNASHTCTYEESSSTGQAVAQSYQRATAQCTTSLNSGDLLAKRLGLLTDLSLTEKGRLCSWNFISRNGHAQIHSHRRLFDIVTFEQLDKMSEIYFEEINPVYKFLDRGMIDHMIQNAAINEVSETSDDPQHCVLYGVAALACLFNEEYSDIEDEIVQKARISLEYSTTLEKLTLNHVASWLLRVIYLRFTSPPKTTWLASCTLMHMIEAINLPADLENRRAGQEKDGPFTLNLKGQLYCTALIFNTWISYDLGKPRLVPHNASPKISMRGWTPEDRLLWKFTNALDPYLSIPSCELEQMLTEVFELKPSHKALQLKRCNISLCIYRRIRENKNLMSSQAMGRILSMAEEGLKTAAEMAERKLPWWHILNVPFQTLCVFLSMGQTADNNAALKRVPDAIKVLELIAAQYGGGSNGIQRTLDCVDTLLEIEEESARERLETVHSFTLQTPRQLRAGYVADTAPDTESVELKNLAGLFDWDDVFETNIFGF